MLRFNVGTQNSAQRLFRRSTGKVFFSPPITGAIPPPAHRYALSWSKTPPLSAHGTHSPVAFGHRATTVWQMTGDPGSGFGWSLWLCCVLWTRVFHQDVPPKLWSGSGIMSSFENNAEGRDHDNRLFAVSVFGHGRACKQVLGQVICVQTDPQDAESLAHTSAKGLICCLLIKKETNQTFN